MSLISQSCIKKEIMDIDGENKYVIVGQIFKITSPKKKNTTSSSESKKAKFQAYTLKNLSQSFNRNAQKETINVPSISNIKEEKDSPNNRTESIKNQKNVVRYIIDLSPNAPQFKNMHSENKKDSRDPEKKRKKIKPEKIGQIHQQKKFPNSENFFMDIFKKMDLIKKKSTK